MQENGKMDLSPDWSQTPDSSSTRALCGLRGCKNRLADNNCIRPCTVCTAHIKSVLVIELSRRAAVVANRSITASMLGVSDQWICSIIRHSRRFSSIEALSAV